MIAESANLGPPPGGHSAQALRTIEGEGRAHAFLARVAAQKDDVDELARIVAALYGPALRGFARVLTKALPRAPDSG